MTIGGQFPPIFASVVLLTAVFPGVHSSTFCTPAALNVPDTYDQYVYDTSLTGRCYAAYTANENRDDAVSACASLGGNAHLLTVSDYGEDVTVRGILANDETYWTWGACTACTDTLPWLSSWGNAEPTTYQPIDRSLNGDTNKDAIQVKVSGSGSVNYRNGRTNEKNGYVCESGPGEVTAASFTLQDGFANSLSEVGTIKFTLSVWDFDPADVVTFTCDDGFVFPSFNSRYTLGGGLTGEPFSITRDPAGGKVSVRRTGGSPVAPGVEMSITMTHLDTPVTAGSYPNFDVKIHRYGDETKVSHVSAAGFSTGPSVVIVEVTAVVPQEGRAAGGYTVTIHGSSMGSGDVSDITDITFGGVSVQAIDAGSTAEQIVVTVEECDPGGVDPCTAGFGNAGNVVVHTTSLGTITGAGLYTYHEPGTITAVVPAAGPEAGGTTVTIQGIGIGSLDVTSAVLAGATAASIVSQTNDAVVVTTGLCDGGCTADGTVYAVTATSTARGEAQPDSGAVGFAYYVPGLVTMVTPLSGSYHGGDTVTIAGSNLATGTDVSDVVIGWASVTQIVSAGPTEVIVETGSCALVSACTSEHAQVVEVVSLTRGTSVGGVADANALFTYNAGWHAVAPLFFAADHPSLGANPPTPTPGPLTITGGDFVNRHTGYVTAFFCRFDYLDENLANPAQVEGTVQATVVSGSVLTCAPPTAEVQWPAVVTVSLVNKTWPVASDINSAVVTTVTFDGAASADDIMASVPATVTAVTPASVPASGGVAITVHGDRMISVSDQGTAPTITVAGQPCVVLGAPAPAETAVACTVAAGVHTLASPPAIVVTNSHGLVSQASTDKFSYDAPHVTAVEPASGCSFGGFMVTLHGANFGANPLPGGVTVDAQFHDQPCLPPVQHISDTMMVCRAPSVTLTGADPLDGSNFATIRTFAFLGGRRIDPADVQPAPTHMSLLMKDCTPVVTAVHPPVLNDTGGVITVLGSSFGPGAPNAPVPVVTIGGRTCGSVSVLPVLGDDAIEQDERSLGYTYLAPEAYTAAGHAESRGLYDPALSPVGSVTVVPLTPRPTLASLLLGAGSSTATLTRDAENAAGIVQYPDSSGTVLPFAGNDLEDHRTAPPLGDRLPLGGASAATQLATRKANLEAVEGVTCAFDGGVAGSDAATSDGSLSVTVAVGGGTSAPLVAGAARSRGAWHAVYTSGANPPPLAEGFGAAAPGPEIAGTAGVTLARVGEGLVFTGGALADPLALDLTTGTYTSLETVSGGNGGSHLERPPLRTSPAAVGGPVAEPSLSRLLVVHGGVSSPGAVVLGDTWIHASASGSAAERHSPGTEIPGGRGWFRVAESAPGPAVSSASAVAVVDHRGPRAGTMAVYLFGGVAASGDTSGELWRLSVTACIARDSPSPARAPTYAAARAIAGGACEPSASWTLLADHTSTLARAGPVFAFIPRLRQVVMWGGVSLADGGTTVNALAGDVYALDVETLEATIAAASGDASHASVAAAAVFTNEGGAGSAPSARSLPAFGVDPLGERVRLWAGTAGSFLDPAAPAAPRDMWSLRTSVDDAVGVTRFTWSQVSTASGPGGAAARVDATAYAGSSLFAYRAATGEHSLAEYAHGPLVLGVSVRSAPFFGDPARDTLVRGRHLGPRVAGSTTGAPDCALCHFGGVARPTPAYEVAGSSGASFTCATPASAPRRRLDVRFTRDCDDNLSSTRGSVGHLPVPGWDSLGEGLSTALGEAAAGVPVHGSEMSLEVEGPVARSVTPEVTDLSAATSVTVTGTGFLGRGEAVEASGTAPRLGMRCVFAVAPSFTTGALAETDAVLLGTGAVECPFPAGLAAAASTAGHGSYPAGVPVRVGVISSALGASQPDPEAGAVAITRALSGTGDLSLSLPGGGMSDLKPGDPGAESHFWGDDGRESLRDPALATRLHDRTGAPAGDVSAGLAPLGPAFRVLATGAHGVVGGVSTTVRYGIDGGADDVVPPTEAPLAGGLAVTVTGTGFVPSSSLACVFDAVNQVDALAGNPITVRGGAVDASAVVAPAAFVSDTAVLCTTPPVAAEGYLLVRVAVASAGAAVSDTTAIEATRSTFALLFTTRPDVDAIAPSVARVTGGEGITITGRGLTIPGRPATDVKCRFGDARSNPAVTVVAASTVTSATRIVCTTPSLTPFEYDPDAGNPTLHTHARQVREVPVYVSNDGGTTWSGAPRYPHYLARHLVRDIAVASDTERVYESLVEGHVPLLSLRAPVIVDTVRPRAVPLGLASVTVTVTGRGFTSEAGLECILGNPAGAHVAAPALDVLPEAVVCEFSGYTAAVGAGAHDVSVSHHGADNAAGLASTGQNPLLTQAIARQALLVHAAPGVTAVSPALFPRGGGGKVTLHGSNFPTAAPALHPHLARDGASADAQAVISVDVPGVTDAAISAHYAAIQGKVHEIGDADPNYPGPGHGANTAPCSVVSAAVAVCDVPPTPLWGGEGLLAGVAISPSSVPGAAYELEGAGAGPGASNAGTVDAAVARISFDGGHTWTAEHGGGGSTMRYTDEPRVLDVEPRWAHVSGGALLTVTGSGLAAFHDATGDGSGANGEYPAVMCLFDSPSATVTHVDSPAPVVTSRVESPGTTLAAGAGVVCTAPSGTVGERGTLRLSLGGAATSQRTTDAVVFTYHGDVEVVEVWPRSVSFYGGETLTLHGTGFVDAASARCHFGALPAISVPATIVSANEATCVTPVISDAPTKTALQGALTRVALSLHGEETHTVTGRNPVDTTAYPALSQITWHEAPVLTGIDPISGPNHGGTAVTLTASTTVSEHDQPHCVFDPVVRGTTYGAESLIATSETVEPGLVVRAEVVGGGPGNTVVCVSPSVRAWAGWDGASEVDFGVSLRLGGDSGRSSPAPTRFVAYRPTSITGAWPRSAPVESPFRLTLYGARFSFGTTALWTAAQKSRARVRISVQPRVVAGAPARAEDTSVAWANGETVVVAALPIVAWDPAFDAGFTDGTLTAENTGNAALAGSGERVVVEVPDLSALGIDVTTASHVVVRYAANGYDFPATSTAHALVTVDPTPEVHAVRPRAALHGEATLVTVFGDKFRDTRDLTCRFSNAAAAGVDEATLPPIFGDNPDDDAGGLADADSGRVASNDGTLVYEESRATFLSPQAVTCVVRKVAAACCGTFRVTVAINGQDHTPSSAAVAVAVRAVPTMTSLSVALGPARGGTAIVVLGSGFEPEDSQALCVFDGTYRVRATVAADGNSVSCVTPPHAQGTVTVTVTSNLARNVGPSLSYEYYDDEVVASVSPAVGLARVSAATDATANSAWRGLEAEHVQGIVHADGTTVTVTGESFLDRPTLACRFGPARVGLAHLGDNAPTDGGSPPEIVAAPAAAQADAVVPATYVSPTVVTCPAPRDVPAGSRVQVDVANNGVDFTSDGVTYAYVAPLSVTAFFPLFGYATGGGAMTLRGDAFPSVVPDMWRCRFRDTGDASSTGPLGGPGQYSLKVTTATRVTATEIRCATPAPMFAAGTQVAVEVSYNDADFFAAAAPQLYSVRAEPKVTAVVPPSVSDRAMVTVTLHGSNFEDESLLQCRFGQFASTSSEFVSASEVKCLVPAPLDVGSRTVRSVQLSVSTNGYEFGEATTFQYHQLPLARDVKPILGFASGGTLITVTGVYFGDGSSITGTVAKCRFGATVVAATWVSPTSMTCVSPGGSAGDRVPVEVSLNGGFEFSDNKVMFEYVVSPTVDSVTPDSAYQGGGTLVTVFGSDFGITPMCKFDGTEVSPLAFLETATSVVCQTPPINPGASTIEVSPNSVDYTSFGTLFTSLVYPVITAIVPTEGLKIGGYDVTVKGSNFVDVPALGCSFELEKVPATFVTTTEIICEAPLYFTGTVDLEVTLDGTTYTEIGTKFTFVAFPSIFTISPMALRGSGSTASDALTVHGKDFVSGLVKCHYMFDAGMVETSAVYVLSTQVLCPGPETATQLGPVELKFFVPDEGIYVATSFAVTFYDDNPVVDRILPRLGSAFGGTLVTVYGRNFVDTSTMRCRFGPLPAEPARWISDDAIECAAPAVAPASAFLDFTIGVSRNGVSFSQSAEKFRWALDPSVTAVVPARGAAAGGTRVTVYGARLVDTLIGGNHVVCRFGLAPVRAVSATATQAVCVAPPAAIAVAGVQPGTEAWLPASASGSLDAAPASVAFDVSINDGYDYLYRGDEADITVAPRSMTMSYDYLPRVDVTAVHPAVADERGSTEITLYGWGFVDGTVDASTATGSDGAGPDPVVVLHNVTAVPGRGGSGVTDATRYGAASAAYAAASTLCRFTHVDHASAGGLPAQPPNVATPAVFVTDTEIRCLTPPAEYSHPTLSGGPGRVEVEVTVNSGHDWTASRSLLTLLPVPSVTAVWPVRSVERAARVVTVHGSNFERLDETLRCRLYAPLRPDITVEATYLSNEALTCVVPVNFTFNATAYDIPEEEPLELVDPNACDTAAGLNRTLPGDLPHCGANVTACVNVTLLLPNGSLPLEAAATVPCPLPEAAGGNNGTDAVPEGYVCSQVVVNATTNEMGTVCVPRPDEQFYGNITIEVSLNDQDYTRDGVTYELVPPAVLTSLEPTFGPDTGGTWLTVRGTGFTPGDEGYVWCRFAENDTPVRSVEVSATHAVCVTPPRTAGVAAVTISVNDRADDSVSSLDFTFNPSAEVTRLEPPLGPATGGTRVTVTGRNFITGPPGLADAYCHFGSAARVPMIALTGTTEAVCISPPSPAGATVESLEIVEVSMNARDVSRSIAQFRYVPAASVATLVPSSVPYGSVVVVTVHGQGFVDNAHLRCVFRVAARSNTTGATVATPLDVTGGVLAEAVWVSPSQVRCRNPLVNVEAWMLTNPAPPATPTYTDVFVTNNGGTDLTLTHREFVYTAVPTVTAVVPNAGVAYDDVITVRGVSLHRDPTAEQCCNFGAMVTPVLEWRNDTEVTCRAPVQVNNRLDPTVAVTVTYSGNCEVAGPGVTFTYRQPSFAVSRVYPAFGPSTGGTVVTVDGEHFVDEPGLIGCRFSVAEPWPSLRRNETFSAFVPGTFVSATRFTCVAPSLKQVMAIPAVDPPLANITNGNGTGNGTSGGAAAAAPEPAPEPLVTTTEIDEVDIEISVNSNAWTRQRTRFSFLTPPRVDSVFPLAGPLHLPARNVTVSGVSFLDVSTLACVFDSRTPFNATLHSTLDANNNTVPTLKDPVSGEPLGPLLGSQVIGARWVSNERVTCETPVSAVPAEYRLSVTLDAAAGVGSINSIPYSLFDWNEVSLNATNTGSGLEAAPNVVTVRGTGFVEPMWCDIATVLSPAVVISPTELTCETPDVVRNGTFPVELSPDGTLFTAVGVSVSLGPCPLGSYCVGNETYPCPLGHECPDTRLAAPLPCDIGTYAPNPGMANCLPCPGGKACTARGENGTSPNFWCPDGYVCDAYTTGLPWGTPCPPGLICVNGTTTTNPLSTLVPASQRPVECVPGHYCAVGVGFMSPVVGEYYYPQPCFAGFYCPTKERDPVGKGPCPTGYFCASGREPLLCPPGAFCPGTGNLFPTPCPAGKWNPDSGKSACIDCPLGGECPRSGMALYDPCPPGRVCDSPGLIVAQRLCPAGFHCPNATDSRFESQGANPPRPCNPGTYCPGGVAYPDIVLGDGLYAQPCDAGYFCLARSPTSSGAGACPQGTYAAVGQSSCTKSPKGSYAPGEGNAAPLPCRVSSHANAEGLAACVQCPSATECPSEGMVDPVPCDRGYYRDASSDGALCLACPAGTWMPANNTGTSVGACEPCPRGTLCISVGVSALGNLTSPPCPAGYYCGPGTNLAALNRQECPAGFYCPQGTTELTARSLPCPAGKFCRTRTTDKDLPSLDCPKGNYCPRGSPRPTECPAGTTTLGRGRSSIAQCVATGETIETIVPTTEEEARRRRLGRRMGRLASMGLVANSDSDRDSDSDDADSQGEGQGIIGQVVGANTTTTGRSSVTTAATTLTTTYLPSPMSPMSRFGIVTTELWPKGSRGPLTDEVADDSSSSSVFVKNINEAPASSSSSSSSTSSVTATRKRRPPPGAATFVPAGAELTLVPVPETPSSGYEEGRSPTPAAGSSSSRAGSALHTEQASRLGVVVLDNPMEVTTLAFDLTVLPAEMLYPDHFEINLRIGANSTSDPLPLPVSLRDSPASARRVFDLNLMSMGSTELSVNLKLLTAQFLNLTSVLGTTLKVRRTKPARSAFSNGAGFVAILDRGSGVHLPMNPPPLDGGVTIHFGGAVGTSPEPYAEIKPPEASLYWGDRSSVVMNYLPFFSSCTGFDSGVPVVLATEHPNCTRVSAEDTVPVLPFAPYQRGKSDSCDLTLECAYEEDLGIVEVSPRWFELPTKAGPFLLSRLPKTVEQLRNPSTFASLTDELGVSVVSERDPDAPARAVPRSVTLEMQYHQHTADERTLVGATLILSDYELPLDAEDGPTPYTLRLQFVPLQYFDVLNAFAFDLVLFTVLYIVLGLVMLSMTLGYVYGARLVILLMGRRRKHENSEGQGDGGEAVGGSGGDDAPPAKAGLAKVRFSMLWTSLVPALTGVFLGSLPVLMACALLTLSVEMLKGVSNSPSGGVVLSDDDIALLQGGRLGAGVFVLGTAATLLMYIVFIPQRRPDQIIIAIRQNVIPAGVVRDGFFDGTTREEVAAQVFDSLVRRDRLRINAKRAHAMFVSMLLTPFLVYVLEFSYSDTFTNNVLVAMVALYIVKVSMDKVVSYAIPDALVGSLIMACHAITEFIIGMGAEGDFILFVIYYIFAVWLEVLERTVIDPMFLEWDRIGESVKDRCWRWFQRKRGIEPEGDPVEPEERDLKNCVIEDQTTFAGNNIALMVTPLTMIAMIFWNTQLQISEVYGARQRDLWFNFGFQMVVVFSQGLGNVFVHNFMEVVWRIPVADYIKECREEYLARKRAWIPYDHAYDPEVDPDLWSSDEFKFSSQLYFAWTVHTSSMMLIIFGISMMLRAQYSPFSDPGTFAMIVLAMLVMFVTYHVTVYTGKVSRIWRNRAHAEHGGLESHEIDELLMKGVNLVDELEEVLESISLSKACATDAQGVNPKQDKEMLLAAKMFKPGESGKQKSRRGVFGSAMGALRSTSSTAGAEDDTTDRRPVVRVDEPASYSASNFVGMTPRLRSPRTREYLAEHEAPWLQQWAKRYVTPEGRVDPARRKPTVVRMESSVSLVSTGPAKAERMGPTESKSSAVAASMMMNDNDSGKKNSGDNDNVPLLFGRDAGGSGGGGGAADKNKSNGEGRVVEQLPQRAGPGSSGGSGGARSARSGGGRSVRYEVSLPGSVANSDDGGSDDLDVLLLSPSHMQKNVTQQQHREMASEPGRLSARSSAAGSDDGDANGKGKGKGKSAAKRSFPGITA